MKNIYKLLMIMVVGGMIFACSEDEADVSTITTDADYTIDEASVTGVGSVSEDAGTQTITFTMTSDFQVRPVTLLVEPSTNSEATEGVDYILNTHEIDVNALSDATLSVSITILQDYSDEADDNEDIVLTIVGERGTPRALDVTVGTIVDNNLTISPNLDITLRWEFVNENILDFLEVTSVCEIVEDLDITVQTPGGGPYDDDLMGYAASTLGCPEHGSFAIADMTEGVAYESWVLIYGGTDLGDLGNMNVLVDYERAGDNGFRGTYVISGVFDSSMPGNGGIYLTMERTGDVLTISDTGGVVASGVATFDGNAAQPIDVDFK